MRESNCDSTRSFVTVVPHVTRWLIKRVYLLTFSYVSVKVGNWSRKGGKV